MSDLSDIGDNVARAARPAICGVIDRKRREQRMSQRELGELMGVSQAQASRWCKYQEPRLDELTGIEKHLGLARGFLLRASGYVDADDGVLAAIAADTELSARSKEALSEVYRGLLRQDGQARDGDTDGA